MDKPLIAILTVNTIAHTVGAILVGVQAKVAYVELYGSAKSTLFGMQFSEELMVGIVSTIMTILILVASEIIPKNHWCDILETIGQLYGQSTKNNGASLKIHRFTLDSATLYQVSRRKRASWKCF